MAYVRCSSEIQHSGDGLEHKEPSIVATTVQRIEYQNDCILAEGALEDDGFLAPGGLGDLRQLVREAVASVVVQPGNLRITDPLLFPTETPKHPLQNARR